MTEYGTVKQSQAVDKADVQTSNIKQVTCPTAYAHEAVQCRFGGENQTAVEAPDTIALKANRTGLPDTLKAGIENISGMSMDDVRVHYNSSKPAQLNALAYAQGNQSHCCPT